MVIKRIENAFEKVDVGLEKMMQAGESGLDAFFNIIEKGLDHTHKAIEFSMDKVFKVVQSFSKQLRYAGLPWTVVIPKIWLWWHLRRTEALPTDKEGIHFFRSPVGGGKSLTSLVLAERTLKLTGHPSYFSSPVEKPQLSEDGEYWYVMHKVEKLDDVYVDGKRVKEWDYDKYPFVNKDERHLRFNPRQNKTKKYNDAWLIEHEDELLMRHEGAKRIYKFSQHMKLDNQEMETAVYMHDIKAIKGLPILQWLKDGLLRVYPYMIQFETYEIEYSFDGTMKRRLVRKWYLPVPIEVLEKFDTHAERRRPIKKEVTKA